MSKKRTTPTPGPLFGWIPPVSRTHAQHQAHEAAMAMAMPRFALEGTYHETKGRFGLWKAMQQVLKPKDPQILPDNWQTSGSCVGAGGGNMLKRLMCVEIAAGDLEEWRVLWWPFTYGRSRFRAGMKTPGEGSFGSAWAAAIKEDGILAIDEARGLPTFKDASGWIQLDSRTEVNWSDGDAQNILELMPTARLHPVGSYVQIRNSDEGKGALANGYGLTLASMFGTRSPKKRGNPAVYIADWDDRWAHQMHCDEAWDHPSEGLLFRIGNNWGPRAHKEPTQGEPWGGFYVTAQTFDRICQGDGEVFAFSHFQGFKVRELDFFV